MNTREGDTFQVEAEDPTHPVTLTVIETPGHISDHLCFLIEEAGEPTMMFTGDHIIGADSVIIYDAKSLFDRHTSPTTPSI